MDKSGIIGEVSETLGGVVKQTVKQVVKTPVDLTKTATAQISGNTPSGDVASELSQIEKSAGQVSDQKQTKPQNPVLSNSNLANNQMEDKAKIEKLRQQLHGMYYQNLTNRQKPPDEHAAEKVEREKREEEMKLAEDNSKKPQELPQTVKQGTGEKLVGVSG